MPDAYRLDILPRASKALDDALANCSAVQRRTAISVCARIFSLLETSPFEFGEEIYDLKSLGMQVRIEIQLPVAIHSGSIESTKLSSFKMQ